ncbi:class I SAM-dependent methyltransferase [Oceanobacillus piezotolerans]|uniref:Class I SAM-dependent methyltransferase n=1 Tax=Oceanobacillus piezotolerans TaxID=2448030 RepID=A0A498DDP5_9BACI|nr:class I SAM-dependent methyltransferase [Oceanobacillus piezotolerans]RLL46790.1 class I SAM-dependent methyltransferase [Oceanobacillus piezotolerans]
MREEIVDQWNAEMYDDKHDFVAKYGMNLIHLLVPKTGEDILDLGCGTGDLTAKLAEFGAEIVGIDKSENMVNQAKQKFPHLTFFVKDATELEAVHSYNAVFSNATLHWVKPPEKVLAVVYQCLKENGRFVAEFGGKGNVKSITDAIIEQRVKAGYTYKETYYPWYYPSIAEYTSLMEETGFRVTYASHYDRPTVLSGEDGLRNWIYMFATSLLEEIEGGAKQEIIEKVEEQLKPSMFEAGNWIADYKRIQVIGIKERN